jgi:hypothetical protein
MKQKIRKTMTEETKEKVKCKCGCGVEINRFDKRNRERFYSIGHGIKININCWNKGKKNIYSKETLEKMSMAKLGTHFRKGKLTSDETKKKLSLIMLNKWKDKKQTKEEKRIKLYAKNRARIYVPINPFCEICHSTENLQRHHWRYDKPLLVNTLCKECHDIQHIKQFNKSCFGRL